MSNKLYKILILSAAMLLTTSCGGGKKETQTETETGTETETSVDPRSDYTPLPLKDVDPFNRTYTKVTSDGIYVNKVENMTDENYIIGMDASSVIAEEESGVKYYDFDGNEADVFKVLSDSGVNYIRVRVWNDPYDSEGHGYGGGNNDIDKAIAIGKRATANKMSLLVDFHYSDFWADPAKQMAPKAWEDMWPDEKAEAMYTFTKTSLQKLVDANVTVGMVQIGNETNGGKIAGEVAWSSSLKLMKRASQAIREVCPDALIAVHFANPEKANNYLNWAKQIQTLDYDVFGSSYYPYWHGTIENLTNILSLVAATYNKRVMVMETSYAFTGEDTDFQGNTISATTGFDVKNYPFTLHGQVNLVREVLDAIVNRTINGLGICYWEGTWISVGGSSWEENHALWEEHGSGWASSYSASYDPNDAGKFYGGCVVDNQAFFDETGHPLESLKVFNLVRYGNEIENKVDGVEDIEVIHYDTDTFTLPEKVNAIYYNNARLPIPVTWDAFDIEAAKAQGNSRHTIHGVADGFDVYCKLVIMEFNFLKDYSFESGSFGKDWKMETTDTLTATHEIKVAKENVLTGEYAAHFWTTDAEGVKFDFYQDVDGLDSGFYKLQLSVIGGGSGTNSIPVRAQNVYVYVLDSKGNEIIRQVHNITNWNDGWKDVNIPRFEVNGKIRVGMHVEIACADCWGDIDDVMLNKTK